MQRDEVAREGVPEAEPEVGDQNLGRQVASDLAKPANKFGALAYVGRKPLAGFRPIVRQVVVAGKLLPQQPGQKLAGAVAGEPDQELAVLGESQPLAESADAERGGSPHRDARRLDRHEVAD